MFKGQIEEDKTNKQTKSKKEWLEMYEKQL